MSFLMMSISNFSDFIGLGVTLSLGFIAIETVKAFTQTLSERLFRFEAFIEEAFVVCKNTLIDKETINAIRAANVNGTSTTNDIEEQKREHERLTCAVAQKTRAMKDEVCMRCQARSMSSICAYHAAIGTLLLLLGSVEERYPSTVSIALTVVSFIALVYTALGWGLGERSIKKKWLGKLASFSSLRHTFYAMVGTLFLVLVTTILRHFAPTIQAFSFITEYYFWSLLIVSLLPFANFIVYIAKIRLKASDIRTQVKKERDTLNKECQTNTDKLQRLREMGEYNTQSPLAIKGQDEKY